jgi:hypothetical protein
MADAYVPVATHRVRKSRKSDRELKKPVFRPIGNQCRTTGALARRMTASAPPVIGPPGEDPAEARIMAADFLLPVGMAH